MAINQQVLMPREKEDALDKLIKGMQVAQGIFGIKTAFEQSELNALKKQQYEQYAKKSAQEMEIDALDLQNKKMKSELESAGIWDSKTFNDNFYAVDDDAVEKLRNRYEYPFQFVRVRVHNPDNEKKYNEVLAVAKDDIKEAQKAFDAARKAQIAEKIAGKKNDPKPTSSTYSAATFAGRIYESNQILDELERGGFDRASLDNSILATITKPLGELGEFFKSPELKMYDQAVRVFINSILRRESGAAIGAEEYKNASLQYFPMAGDNEQVKAQKRASRLQVQKALETEAKYGLTDDVINTLRGAQNTISGKSTPFYQGQGTNTNQSIPEESNWIMRYLNSSE